MAIERRPASLRSPRIRRVALIALTSLVAACGNAVREEAAQSGSAGAGTEANLPAGGTGGTAGAPVWGIAPSPFVPFADGGCGGECAEDVPLDCDARSSSDDVAIGPSCEGLGLTCGPCADDCCRTSLIQSGTSSTQTIPGTVFEVAAFRLDKYEVTVGRFAKFWADYPRNLPKAGEGKNPYAQTPDAGWDVLWNSQFLPVTQAELTQAIECDPELATWHMGDQRLPMNCLTWHIAQAFCLWDGGRLPADVEWQRALVADDERPYPWGTAPPHSRFAVIGSDSPAVVGSRSPKGDGAWGQSDLVGNVGEFVIDAYYPLAVTDEPFRIQRGGAFKGAVPRSTDLSFGFQAFRQPTVGARCVMR